LIKGFCKENKVEKGLKLYKELKALGLKPSGMAYAALVRNLKMSDSVATSLNLEIV
jgi:pentatricopeptide repeat protein